MSAVSSNFSADVLWEITRNQSSYLVKRSHGQPFSKDPLNLTNKNSRKYSGLVNPKAIGIQPAEHGVLMLAKRDQAKYGQKPAQVYIKTPLKSQKPQKVYQAIVTAAAPKGKGGKDPKNKYRPDIAYEAVARASQILYSQRPKKDAPEKKPRGKKAKAEAEKSA